MSRHRLDAQPWRERGRLAVRASALLVFLLGGLLWLRLDQDVTVRIDGVAQRLHTRAPDVATLLTDLGYSVGDRDRVTPSLRASLSDGVTVELARARPLRLTLDGVTSTRWVTARSVSAALRQTGAPVKNIRLSLARATKVPLRGLSLRVGTRKSVTLTTGSASTPVTTYAGTVDELLAEQELSVDADDRTEPARSAPLTDGASVLVRHVTLRHAVETLTVPAPEEKSGDPDLMEDQISVTEPGEEGRSEETVDYYESEGQVLERKVVSTKVLTAPRPRRITAGSTPYPADDTGLNWSALASCESGGRAGVVSSNGLYHGLYQFGVATWQSMGGIGVPSAATPREQTYRAILLYKRSGAGQWPECGPRLFS